MPFNVYSDTTKRIDRNSTKFLYFFIYLNDHAILELRIIVKFDISQYKCCGWHVHFVREKLSENLNRDLRPSGVLIVSTARSP